MRRRIIVPYIDRKPVLPSWVTGWDGLRFGRTKRGQPIPEDCCEVRARGTPPSRTEALEARLDSLTRALEASGDAKLAVVARAARREP